MQVASERTLLQVDWPVPVITNKFASKPKLSYFEMSAFENMMS